VQHPAAITGRQTAPARRPVARCPDLPVNRTVSDRRRKPRVLGEYELDGGAFAVARTAVRGEQRDTRVPGQRLRALSRPGTLWRAVLRRIRTDSL
jgi:hypothetical protein